MTKKIIAVDMDDTLVWLMKAMRKDHNKKHPDWEVKYEDMVAFANDMLHPDYDKMEFFRQPELFFNLELIDEHVVREMKKLHEDYDLLIVTSAFSETVHDKWRWVQKYLPFIPHKNFITASRKDLIQADILIDDAIHNVKDWVATGRRAVVLSHHWNQELKDMEGVTMVYGWHGMKEIVDFIIRQGE